MNDDSFISGCSNSGARVFRYIDEESKKKRGKPVTFFSGDLRLLAKVVRVHSTPYIAGNRDLPLDAALP
jgi:hypothetical protein